MSHSGYYEIVGSTVNRTGLKMNVIAGNILFNRLQPGNHLLHPRKRTGENTGGGLRAEGK